MVISGAASHRRGLALVLMAGLLWSTSGLFIKLLTLSPFQILGWRSLVAALATPLLARAFGIHLKIKLDLGSLAGALCYASVLGGFVVATKLTTAANAIFLQFTAPIFILLLEPWLLKTRLGARELLAVGSCVAGMACFFVGRLSPGDWLGNLLALASGVGLAGFSLQMRHRSLTRPEEHPGGVLVLGNALVVLLTSPWLLAGGWPSLGQGAALAYLGAFQLGLAYLLFSSGIRRLTATEAGLTSMVEAVFNPLWVFFGIGERPSPWALVGGVVILGTILTYGLRRPAVLEPPQG